jgi:hypothetical protein
LSISFTLYPLQQTLGAKPFGTDAGSTNERQELAYHTVFGSPLRLARKGFCA